MAPLRTLARHHRSSLHQTLQVTLLAGLLLLMQSMVLQHQLDFDHHPGGEPCELCLHLSALDHGVMTTLPALQPAQADLPVVAWSFAAAPSPLSPFYHPRAPPQLS